MIDPAAKVVWTICDLYVEQGSGQLMKRAPEGECPCKSRIGEYLYQGPADDQILLYLEVLVPGCVRPLLGDVIPRDHESASMLAFTNSRQSFDRGASVPHHAVS